MPRGTESGRGGRWRSAGPGIPRGAGVLKTCLGTTRTKARKERLTTPAPYPGPHGYSDRAVKTVPETNLLFSGLEDWKFWPHTHSVSQTSSITVSLAGVPPGPRQRPFPTWSPPTASGPGLPGDGRWGSQGRTVLYCRATKTQGPGCPGRGWHWGLGAHPAQSSDTQRPPRHAVTPLPNTHTLTAAHNGLLSNPQDGGN